MFDALIETRGTGVRSRAIWTVPVAASVHFLVVGGAIAASLLALQQVPEFQNPFGLQPICMGLGDGSILPPLGEGGVKPKSTETALRRQPEARRDAVQPSAIPEAAPASAAAEEAIEDALPGTSASGAGFAGIEGNGSGVPWGAPGSYGEGLGAGPGTGGGRVDAPPAPLELTPDMVPPVLVRKVPPGYPELARTARLPGFVLLEAVVGEDGGVDDVTVLKASSPLFVDAAVGAVRQWRYRPALQNGRPVRVYFTVRVEFQLR